MRTCFPAASSALTASRIRPSATSSSSSLVIGSATRPLTTTRARFPAAWISSRTAEPARHVPRPIAIGDEHGDRNVFLRRHRTVRGWQVPRVLPRAWPHRYLHTARGFAQSPLRPESATSESVSSRTFRRASASRAEIARIRAMWLARSPLARRSRSSASSPRSSASRPPLPRSTSRFAACTVSDLRREHARARTRTAAADEVRPRLGAGTHNLGICSATKTVEDVGGPRDRLGYAQAESSQACDDTARDFGFGDESFANALCQRLDSDCRTCPSEGA